MLTFNFSLPAAKKSVRKYEKEIKNADERRENIKKKNISIKEKMSRGTAKIIASFKSRILKKKTQLL
jgi:hypothetical protein